MLSLQNKWPDTSWTSLKSQKSQTWQQMETKTSFLWWAVTQLQQPSWPWTGSRLIMNRSLCFFFINTFHNPFDLFKSLVSGLHSHASWIQCPVFWIFLRLWKPLPDPTHETQAETKQNLVFPPQLWSSYGIGAGRRWVVTSVTPSGAREEISL